MAITRLPSGLRRSRAKLDLTVLDRLATRNDVPLVCVTSITPTRSGEAREPSLGPSSASRAAAGGGYAHVIRWEA